MEAKYYKICIVKENEVRLVFVAYCDRVTLEKMVSLFKELNGCPCFAVADDDYFLCDYEDETDG